MKFICYIFLAAIFFISCDKIVKRSRENGGFPKDTIKKPERIFLDKNCLGQTQGYKDRYGLVFSNYYRDKVLSINFDNDETIDTIAVLKPYYENSNDDCYSANSESDFPFLIISKTIKNKSTLFKIYKNALRINGANYYEEVNIKNDGFIISKDYNGNNGFFSKTYISFKESDFYVDSISVESWGSHQYNKTIKFRDKAFDLSKYKRTDIDSIRNLLDKD
ncbi:hypothetical protein [Flavobacterium aestivum]|uniref:hypothetical protein n=1 Tax=Flavobacterium aestivum TaxID=3003257 RepID=UPI0024823AC1|nr:hypothetical protein [Flavobacterium aestivum]